MNEVIIITTGGTIVSVMRENGASPDAEQTLNLLEKTEKYFEINGINCRVCRIFGDVGYDSSDIGPEQWLKLTETITDVLAEGVRGVLILHGTDTMAYTSAWLSLCFANVNVPIVITGSQKIPGSENFDGDSNLLGAAQFVKNGTPGVRLFFNGSAYRGDRVHKSDAVDIDAFTGVVSMPKMFEEQQHNHTCMAAVKPSETLCALSVFYGDKKQVSLRNDIACCRITPGLGINLTGNESILIIEGYGAGNMPRSIHKSIEEIYSNRKKPHIIACSQAEHGLKNPLAYCGVGIGELSRKDFTVWNQGEYPMEFICALSHLALICCSDDPESVIGKYLLRVKAAD